MFNFFKKNPKFSFFLGFLVFMSVSAWWTGGPIYGPWPWPPSNSALGDVPAIWNLGSSTVNQSADLIYSLVFAFLLFIVGLFGVWNNDKNVLVLMLCIELILLSSTLNFIIFSILWYDPVGQIYALVVLTMAACESAIGLGLLISAYYLKKGISFSSFCGLKS